MREPTYLKYVDRLKFYLQKEIGYQYECDLLSFFELGSVHYDYYLINVKVPVEPYSDVNMKIGKLTDMNMVVCLYVIIIWTFQHLAYCKM